MFNIQIKLIYSEFFLDFLLFLTHSISHEFDALNSEISSCFFFLDLVADPPSDTFVSSLRFNLSCSSILASLPFILIPCLAPLVRVRAK